MAIYITRLFVSNRLTEEKKSKDSLVLCECGCGRVFGASQMLLFGNANGGYERIFKLHADQIWGNTSDKQKLPRF